MTFQGKRPPGPLIQMNTEAPRQTGRGNMAHSHVRGRVGRFTTKQTRTSLQAGFQLVEMLIALLILAVVAAVAIPSYSGYLERVDFATTKADITILVQAIEEFYIDNSSYPDSLNDIGRGGMSDPWGNVYRYLKIYGANLKGKGKVRKDKSLNPVNSDFDLYSAGKDGQTKLPFPPKVSHDDIVRASNGKFIGYAADF